jgi:hypothetical protein
MTTACAAPLAWEQLVDYWAGDLDAEESDRVEEHVFACAACARELERVARIAEAFRRQIPPVVSPEQVAALRARGVAIEENVIPPGARREVTFARDVEVMVHRLGGLDLSRTERVELTVKVESTGDVLMVDPLAPFDRERGEVLIACQRHFALFPPDIVFEVRAHEPSGASTTATFIVPHVFTG